MQSSGSPAAAFTSPTCSRWTFLHTWDDESNFITSPPPFMSPLTRPESDSSMLNVVQEALVMVRINVYEPLAWIVGKAWIVRGMWSEAGEADQLNFAHYSFLVRRQSLVIHCLNAGLLGFFIFIILDRTGKQQAGIGGAVSAALAATLWAVHPCHAEVVGWPSANPYTLCGFFALLCGVAHAATIGAKHKRTGVVVVLICALYACSVLSKSASITLPGALLALDAWYWLQEGGLKGALKGGLEGWKVYPPLVLTSVGLAYVTLVANEEGVVHTSDLVNFIESGWLGRILKSLITLSLYLRQAFWPADLRVHYVVNEGGLTMSSPEVLLCVGLWSSAAVICSTSLVRSVRHGSKHDWVAATSFILATYLLLFLPTMGLVQHGMIQKGGDRYAYLTYLPFAVGLGCWGKNRLSLTVIVVVSVMTLTFGGLSRGQLCTYCDDESMFQRALAVDPFDWRIVDTYAEFLYRTGRRDEGAGLVRRSLDVQPRNGLKSMLVKGKSLVWLGEAGLACDNYDNWWVEHPEDRSMPLLKNNFALCLLRDKNRREEAEGMFREALEASSVDDHVKKIGGNLELLKEWDGEGYFTGSLMW
ncbi:hypothetical protein TrST_g711 [Triparma strigata]|uniref:Uncharacterized protein n=1 Tax=Triparma strigata TaxID=1606541 RepID=A0A9W7BCY6_9STRA|nr:hypothetical protein TrST_g711 [Triparma strigata]